MRSSEPLAVQTARYVRRALRSVRKVLTSPVRTPLEAREIALAALEHLHNSLDPETSPIIRAHRALTPEDRAEEVRRFLRSLPLEADVLQIALRDINDQERRERRAEARGG